MHGPRRGQTEYIPMEGASSTTRSVDFFFFKISFPNNTLEDYIEASVMLQYNSC